MASNRHAHQHQHHQHQHQHSHRGLHDQYCRRVTFHDVASIQHQYAHGGGDSDGNKSGGESSATSQLASVEPARRPSGAESFSMVHKASLRDRISCFQWTYFTMTMATGGVSHALASLPYNQEWIRILGLILYFLNLVLFVVNLTMLVMRFWHRPVSFLESLHDQMEGLFAPSFLVSISILIITTAEYGVPHTGVWLIRLIQACFWTHVFASTLLSAVMYLILWSTTSFPIQNMTPIWVFPAYPLLLNGPMATVYLRTAISVGHLEHINVVAVICCAVATQGTGWLISFMVSSAFLYRLMTQKLPRDSQRAGIFISLGPSAFTVTGIVGLANLSPSILPDDFLGIPGAPAILRVIAILVGLWLWGLSIWYFLVSAGSLIEYLRPGRRLPFAMNWFSFVFPNAALVTATIQLGDALDNAGLHNLGCVMAALLFVVWALVFAHMLRSMWQRELLYPCERKASSATQA